VFILLFPRGMVSLHAEPTSQAGRVLRRIERLHGLVKPTPEWIFYAPLDAITDKYEPLLADAMTVVSRIDDMLSLAGEQEARGVVWWRTERFRGSPSGTSDSRTLCGVVGWGISRQSLPREVIITHLLDRTTGGLFLRNPMPEMMSVPV
jgi:Mg2+ and Co2+ transporter CorA